MVDSEAESLAPTITFRFASGQILSLDEKTIEQIPYLAAIVSSADCFESARDDDGHYKLDPNIDYKDFQFVIDSLSFNAVRQLFTLLPKQNDIIPIIALLDFLGLAPQPDPTLQDVDSIFFSNLVYSPMLCEHVQIIKQSILQDMAVRFAIAMVKEEYNFRNGKVIDQIYWFIMFILSAHKLFGPRLRYHVYKIAQHYFSIFQPSILKSFRKLIQRVETNRKNIVRIVDENDNDSDDNGSDDNGSDDNGSDDNGSDDNGFDNNVSDDDYSVTLQQPLTRISSRFFWGLTFLRRTIRDRQELLLRGIYNNHRSFWSRNSIDSKKILEPVYRRVIEIMYELLQSDICRRAVIEIRKRKYLVTTDKTETVNSVKSSSPSFFKELPKDIYDVFHNDLVYAEINQHLTNALVLLRPKLEQRLRELKKKLRDYEQERNQQNFLDEFHIRNFALYFDYKHLRFEQLKEEALAHEIILEKLSQGFSVQEELRKCVLDEIHSVALQQFTQWRQTERTIRQLYSKLSRKSAATPFSFLFNAMHPKHQVQKQKPLPKLQYKHPLRQLKKSSLNALSFRHIK